MPATPCEKTSQVEFLGPVEMDEGPTALSPKSHLPRTPRLEKKSVLTGNLKVGLTIADGAKHNGQVRMGLL